MYLRAHGTAAVPVSVQQALCAARAGAHTGMHTNSTRVLQHGAFGPGLPRTQATRAASRSWTELPLS